MHSIRPDRDERDVVIAAQGWTSRHATIVALLILGTLLLVRGLLPMLIHWPYDYSEPVRAQIVESRFEDAAGWQGFFRTRAVFNYRYVHQGELFLSSSYRPTGKRAEAVRRYLPGLAIDAYVDTDHPTRAMVKPGLTAGDLATPALGLVLLILGLSLLRRIRC